MKFWTGCSGWQYDEWKEVFYPNELPKSHWLSYYSVHFNSVEVNNTFYQFPNEKSLKKWRESVPNYFKFSLKANRLITHYYKFNHTEDLIKNFYQLSDILEDYLSCILFQLPKPIQYDEQFMKKIASQLSVDKKNVVEFQHDSWWRQDVVDFFAKRHIIFAHINSPIIQQDYLYPGIFTYIRMHGAKNWYQGSYGRTKLNNLLLEISNFPSTEEVWCYFDNTASGDAVKDAIVWQKLVSDSN
jgi:uncharacterized protein YecE (DUF72 family)